METSGFAQKETVKLFMDAVDCWLYDFKAGTEEKHRLLCGCSALPIRENFQMLYETGAHLILRYPMVPGINDGQEDLDGLMCLLAKTSVGIPVEILPYHRMGKTKADRVGKRYPDFLPDEDADRTIIEERRQKLLALGAKNVRICG